MKKLDLKQLEKVNGGSCFSGMITAFMAGGSATMEFAPAFIGLMLAGCIIGALDEE